MVPINANVLAQANARPSALTDQCSDARTPAFVDDQIYKVADVKRKCRDQIDRAQSESEVGAGAQ